jgi:hypothetical protein
MRAMRSWILALLAACGAAPAVPAKPAAPPPDPRLEHVDVFGSSQVTRDQVLAAAGADLAALVTATENRDDSFGEHYEAATAAIAKLGDFAYVEISPITYYKPPAVYLTVDLVDAADAKTRMTFADAPTGDVPDPDGLLAAWSAYEQKAFAVMRTGTASDAGCPVWHCMIIDPSLATDLDDFAKRVPAHEAELAKILREDKDEDERAYAAFLLAHLADGQRVVELLMPAFRDPSHLVRNNAMRVVALIARDHAELDIPLEPVLTALRFPGNTDRNKAGAILAGIVEHDPSRAKAIVAEVGDVLREMAASRQPNNRNFAVEILAAAK